MAFPQSKSLKIMFLSKQVQSIVDEYKNANAMVANDCRTITQMLLVNIDGKRVYDNLEFEEEQVSNLYECKAVASLCWNHQMI